MKQYVTMKLVIIFSEDKDIITTSGDNEKTTDVFDFLS